MIRRIAVSAALAAAALAAPASAVGACTPSTPEVTLGGCVDVVCLKLCVTQIEVDPQCSLDRPAPLAVQWVCSQVEQQYLVIGG